IAFVKASEYGLVSSSTPPFADNTQDTTALAQARLNAFFDAIGARIIPFETVTVSKLLDLYFAPAPPFSASGKKKSEFPDAIALLSLETWARTKGKRILAVSADKDWITFAEQCDHIDVVPKLENGLAKLQEHIEEATEISLVLVQSIETR